MGISNRTIQYFLQSCHRSSVVVLKGEDNESSPHKMDSELALAALTVPLPIPVSRRSSFGGIRSKTWSRKVDPLYIGLNTHVVVLSVCPIQSTAPNRSGIGYTRNLSPKGTVGMSTKS